MRSVILLVLMCLTFLGACALPDNIVVMLPDENDQASSVTVSNASGKTELTKPLAAVSLEQGAAPSQPFVAEQQPVAKVFRRVLQSIPRSPAVFVIYFEPGSTQIAAASRADFATAIETTRTRADADISVVAHADMAGLPGDTQDLSWMRAQSVRDALIRAGVSPAAIETANYRASIPIVPAPAGVAEPRNVRVEVTIR